MKLPILWLRDYLGVDDAGYAAALCAACARWELRAQDDPARTLGQLLTFAGFACEGIAGSGQDAVLELDVLANRPDGQCIVGLAREAAAVLRVPLKLPPAELKETGPTAGSLAQVEVQDAQGCPRYTGRVIQGVKVGPSPEWLQARLKAMGLIPRNNIVDITNFICFELNQPLHAFDLNRLAGRKIVVRRARAGEPFTPLYDQVPPLTAETLVISDASRAVAIAGIIGGMGTEVTAETKEILLEAAYFDPASTRRTCRRLKVGTDSSFRFERGIDLEAVAEASARATRLIVEIAGGTIAKGVLDSNPKPRQPKEVTLRQRRLTALAGMAVTREEARGYLEALGCRTVEQKPESLRVQVPSWRRGDLEREADLIEDVARLHGYNHVPAETAMRARIAPRSALEVVLDRVRDLCTGLGYFECWTDSLVDPRWPAPAVWTPEKPLALDPRSVLREDHSALRNSLLVSLLDVHRLNQNRRAGEARLFECGKVFLPKKGEARPEERPVLGMLDERGFTVLADALRRLPEALELTGAKLELRPCAAGRAPEFLAAETACRLVLVDEKGEEEAGWVGLAAPSLAQAFDLKRAGAVAEVDLARLAACGRAPRRFQELPTQPEVVRDVAMVVEEGVSWGEIEAFVTGYQAREPLRDAREAPRFLSAYRGKQAGAGKKSVAFSVVYRAAERSLTDEEVNAAHQRFVAALLERFHAALRA